MSTKLSNISQKYPWVLIGGGLVGLVASVWQAAERVQMLKEPQAPLSCNLNPVIDCGGVLGNRWAALFGFPNAFIGIAIFAMLVMAGIALLGNTKPTKLLLRAVLSISTVLILFSFWFFGMSLYVIGKVCIFCIFIWAVSVPIFWYGLLHHLQAFPPRKAWLKVQAFGTKHYIDVLFLVYAMMLILYLTRFRSYYFG